MNLPKQYISNQFRRTGGVSIIRNLFIVCCAIAFVSAYFYVPSFFALDNIVRVLREASIPGLMAIGVTFVVITGRLDLSVGSILSASAIASVLVYNSTGMLALAIAVPVGIGILIGLANGVLVAYLKLNSLITTLAMLSIIQGLALFYTGGADIVVSDRTSTSAFVTLGRGFLGEIPVPVIVFAALVIVAALLLHSTNYGRTVFAVGGNYVASVYSAINNKFVIFNAYLISGALSGFAGAVYAARVGTARHNSGQGMELLVLAMVILGGTSLFGGSGSVGRTVIGIIVIACLQNILLLMGLPFYSQWIGVALVLIGVTWWYNNRRVRKKVVK